MPSMSDPSRSSGGEIPTAGETPAASAGTGDAPSPGSGSDSPATTAPQAGAERKGGLRRPRGFEWVIVALAVLVAWKLWDWRGQTAGPGKDTDAPITLVTSDREDLACGFGGSVGRYRCGFDANGKPWPDPPAAADRLAPYYTTNRQLYLIPGLFEQSALAKRYASELPSNVPRDKQKRFVARCQLHLVQKVDHFKTRWLAGAPFNDSDGAWVAEPTSCTVLNE
jgi:hypothetical protein